MKVGKWGCGEGGWYIWYLERRVCVEEWREGEKGREDVKGKS